MPENELDRRRFLRRIGAEQTIQIPSEIDEWRAKDPEKARSLQARVREEFQKYFGQGLAVIGYERNEQGGAFQLGLLKA